MTLCPTCTTRHRAAIEFAATIIDVELAGRRRSQAAADLRAMLPPKTSDEALEQLRAALAGPQPIEGEPA